VDVGRTTVGMGRSVGRVIAGFAVGGVFIGDRFTFSRLSRLAGCDWKIFGVFLGDSCNGAFGAKAGRGVLFIVVAVGGESSEAGRRPVERNFGIPPANRPPSCGPLGAGAALALPEEDRPAAPPPAGSLVLPTRS
jgi:hypothetical protein